MEEGISKNDLNLMIGLLNMWNIFPIFLQNTLLKFVMEDGIHYIQKVVNKLNILIACEESQRVCIEFK